MPVNLSQRHNGACITIDGLRAFGLLLGLRAACDHPLKRIRLNYVLDRYFADCIMKLVNDTMVQPEVTGAGYPANSEFLDLPNF